MRVLIYRSQGTDDLQIACQTVEEAINCFRADADVILHDGESEYYIELRAAEMTEEELARVQEA